MISIHNDVVFKAIRKYKLDVDEFTADAKRRLLSLAKKVNGDEKEYVKFLCKNIRTLVKADKKGLDSLKIEFNKILDPKKISEFKKDFKDKVLIALDYTGLRSNFYPKYFNELGIKACVYCNSALAVSVYSEKKSKTIAKFQLDHYYAKSKYPCFGISLFNLYPVCGSCNNIKKEKDVDFELYTDDNKKTKTSHFKYSLERAGIARYLLTRNSEEIKIKFEEPPVTIKDCKSFNDAFDIEGIYNTQKDLAEELIIRARVYNKPYKQKLMDAFPKIFNETSLSNRILIGNYCDPEDIHKRPMAIFTQDIAKQLGLI